MRQPPNTVPYNVRPPSSSVLGLPPPRFDEVDGPETADNGRYLCFTVASKHVSGIAAAGTAVFDSAGERVFCIDCLITP